MHVPLISRYHLLCTSILTLAMLMLIAPPITAQEAAMTHKPATTPKVYLKDISTLSKLDKMQQYVTQHDGTEPAFDNAYWDHKEEGIYVDVVSGEPLFSSVDKYDSGTGWPSFTRAITPAGVTTDTDHKLGYSRTEIRSKQGDSHLGHVFEDGPVEYGGKRFCINSAALRFVPKAELESAGYGEYLSLFE